MCIYIYLYIYLRYLHVLCSIQTYNFIEFFRTNEAWLGDQLRFKLIIYIDLCANIISN